LWTSNYTSSVRILIYRKTHTIDLPRPREGDRESGKGRFGLVVCPSIVWGGVIPEEPVDHFPRFVGSDVAVGAEGVVCGYTRETPGCVGIYEYVLIGGFGGERC
jgi:hypothetical protein